MWQETKHGLYKKFEFGNFQKAWVFMERVAGLSEKRQHHPRWENDYGSVQIWLVSHDAGNKITEKDREMAAAIDALLFASEEVKVKKVQTHPGQVGRLKVYTDGGSRGNPGPSASGFVLLNEDGEILVDKGVYLGITTNNQAEYTALKLALEEAKKIGASELAVYMDSLLVVNQMNGIFKIKNRDLWPLHDAIKQLATGFKKISFTHVPRELNKLADAAVNRALDEQLRINK